MIMLRKPQCWHISSICPQSSSQPLRSGLQHWLLDWALDLLVTYQWSVSWCRLPGYRRPSQRWCYFSPKPPWKVFRAHRPVLAHVLLRLPVSLPNRICYQSISCSRLRSRAAQRWKTTFEYLHILSIRRAPPLRTGDQLLNDFSSVTSYTSKIPIAPL